MVTLNQIRASLSDEQRAILNAVWKYHIGSKERLEWMPPTALYHQFADLKASRKSGKDLVQRALSSLNGSIIYEHQAHCYALTFIGVLFTAEGEDGVDLLARCLELFQSKYDSVLSLNQISITSQEIASALSLSKDQLKLLYELIGLSQIANAGGDRDQWTVSVTDWRDEFLSEDDLRAYVEQQAFNGYDPSLPVAHNERSRYLQEKQNKNIPTEFSFIRNNNLREILDADWKEAQTVYAVRAWKSCVILCGSILEGMLFDMLNRDEPKSLSAYHERTGKPAKSLRDLNLASLVDTAGQLKMLPREAFHLSHALRHFRNLVHPEKLLREKVEVTDEEADIALSSVKKLLRIGTAM